jgi:hypothetical protein
MFAGVALLALGIGGVLPGMWATPAHAADIDAKIAAAKTAADHEAIAAWYDEQAKEAQAKADEHKKMGESYKKMGGAAVKLDLPGHCTYFTNAFTAEAKKYAEMAAAHRQMAKDAK